LTDRQVPERCDLITVDVSFISLVKVAPALLPLLAPDGELLTMIKPQFEAGRGNVGKGGVIRDPGQRRAIIERTIVELQALGLEAIGEVDSEVPGVRGNREAFALFRRDRSGNVSP
jgi:23S rRNA (cytidine1920-2'-O)/16S rRNA (cytidine1409-2'-O)-methyltransferase